MADVYRVAKTTMDGIVSAIHAKNGETAGYTAAQMADKIRAIPTGGDLPTLDNPASAEDILAGKEALDGAGQKITGTLDTLADVEITDWEEIGGYLAVIAENTATGDTKEITTPIEVYEGAVDVSLATQTVAEDKYSAGVTINGLTGARLTQLAPDAVPENIAAGKDIVGIIGTAELEDPTAKPLIANAITAKGVPTQETDSWDTMALHIGQISGGSEELAGLIDGTATEITVPDGVTDIRIGAFANCARLTNVILPESVKTLGINAFSSCSSISITSLPSGVTSIGQSAFNGCTKLALTELPNGITVINNLVFYNCYKIALTSLPSGITSIGSSAFQHCGKLSLSQIPAAVATIGASAFYGCLGITEMTFAGKPTTINATAFQNCTNLLDIYVPWSEGEVANAPWGATNATIHYNHTP